MLFCSERTKQQVTGDKVAGLQGVKRSLCCRFKGALQVDAVDGLMANIAGCRLDANLRHARCSKSSLLDHLVGAAEQRLRNGKTKRLGSLQVDHQFVSGWRLHRQVGQLFTL